MTLSSPKASLPTNAWWSPVRCWCGRAAKCASAMGPQLPARRRQHKQQDEPGSRSAVVNLSELFIRRPVMTVALSVSVILFGLVAYFQLPVSDLPAVDYPGDPGAGELSGRHSGDDGQQRGHAAGAPVHADSRARAGDLEQHAGPHQLRAAVRSLEEPGRSRDRRAGGDHARVRAAAGRSAESADLHQDQPERSADHVPRAGQRHGDRRPALRLRQHASRRAAQHSARCQPGCGVRHAVGGARQGRSLGDGDPQHHAGRPDQRHQERHQLYRRGPV